MPLRDLKLNNLFDDFDELTPSKVAPSHCSGLGSESGSGSWCSGSGSGSGCSGLGSDLGSEKSGSGSSSSKLSIKEVDIEG